MEKAFLLWTFRYIEARVTHLGVLKDEGYGERMINKPFRLGNHLSCVRKP